MRNVNWQQFKKFKFVIKILDVKQNIAKYSFNYIFLHL